MGENNYWNRKTFCLITGASRGIGRCLAVEFSKKLGPGSVLLLLARSQSGLEGTKAEIIKQLTQLDQQPQIKIEVAAIDLGNPDVKLFQTIIEDSLTNTQSQKHSFDHAMIVQNAASLGIQSGHKISEIEDLTEIREYYSFNLDSFILLNAIFFNKIFGEKEAKTRSIVHISSLGAVEPFKTWGLYCAGKAARDMLLKSMALESGIHAINWAPGCVNTDIYEEAVKFTADPELAKAFEEDRKAGKVLSCEQTVRKLMKVLAGQKFTKGEHVAYEQFPDDD